MNTIIKKAAIKKDNENGVWDVNFPDGTSSWYYTKGEAIMKAKKFNNGDCAGGIPGNYDKSIIKEHRTTRDHIIALMEEYTIMDNTLFGDYQDKLQALSNKITAICELEMDSCVHDNLIWLQEGIDSVIERIVNIPSTNGLEKMLNKYMPA